MRFFSFIITVVAIASTVFAQDTTLTVSSEGNVGIGTTKPEFKLHINGGLQLDKSGPELDRLILRTVSQNDPGRYGILFSNNKVAPFLGDDIDNQNYGFYSTWGSTRKYDAVLKIHGKANGKWGNALQLTHDGTDGYITTDTGNLILDPADGSSNVGIGTNAPEEKMQVNGTIYSSDGGFKFPDGTIQTSAIGTMETFYTQFGNLNNGKSTVTTAWTELNTTAGEHTFKKRYADSKIEVYVNTDVTVQTYTITNTRVQFYPWVDDNTSPVIGNYAAIRYPDQEKFISLFAVFADLPKGTHTVSLKARTDTGSASGVIVDMSNWGGRIIIKETW